MTKDGCPPGWFDDPDLPGGGDSCYMLKTHPETWTMAQTYCSYDQANLVTISTLKEEQVLTGGCPLKCDSFQVSVCFRQTYFLS